MPKELPRKGIGEGATELQQSHQYHASTMGQQQPEKSAGLNLEEKLCVLQRVELGLSGPI